MLTTLLGDRRMDAGRDPASGFWYGPVGVKTVAGINVTAIRSLTMAAVWCANRYLCGIIGSLPLNYYQTTGNDRFLLSSDPVQRLLKHRPNPKMRPSTFKSMMTYCQINKGNAYAEIQWQDSQTKGEPFAIWPINPDHVTTRLFKDDNGAYFYEVKVPGGTPEYVDMDSMIHIPNIITMDGLFGIGVFDQARETIAGGLAAEAESNRTFSTGRMPKIVIEDPKVPSPEARANFRKEWREIHSDAREDVALLVNGMTAKVLSSNLRDSQFTELRQFIIEETARWYGLPPQKLQHLLRTSYNSAEQLNTECVTDTLVPQAKPWEEELEYKLTPESKRGERSVRFAFQGLMRGDTNARASFYSTMLDRGVLNRNEVRELEDYNSVDGGDTFLTQGANVALDDNGEPMPPAASQAMQEFGNPAMATDAVKRAARELLAASLDRMVKRESLAVTRWSLKPHSFSSEVDKFYCDHEGVVADAIRPILDACCTFGVTLSPAAMSAMWCRESRADLINASSGSDPENLADAVASMVAKWEQGRVAAAVAKVSELN